VTPKKITWGMDVLHQMKSLNSLSAGSGYLPAAEFWKRHADGEFNT
jgi:hypothetical protein